MAQQSKLKVGLVLDTSLDATDGVPQYVTEVGEWLRGQGHDVYYLVGETSRNDLSSIHSLSRNINVRFNGNRTNIPLPASSRKIKQLVQSEKFDILHVQTPHHPLMAQRVLLAASPNTGVVGSFHILPYGFMSRWGNKLLGWWLRPSLKRIDEMVAVSPAARDFCRQSFGVEAEVVPNAISYARFSEAKPLQKYQDKKLNILFLGRLVRRKGCQVLLQAIAELSNTPQLREFRVIICGRGPLLKELEAFVEANGLREVVEFAGFISEEEKPRYYASADIAVFPSSGGESFGIVLIEAMASGKATVLAGDNPGYRSVMSPQADLLFDPKNPRQLAHKLELYLKDAKLRKKMAAWGSGHSKQFDINVVGRKLLDVYGEALRKRRNQ